jgi:formate hydrogenlyase transcriptional activator
VLCDVSGQCYSAYLDIDNSTASNMIGARIVPDYWFHLPNGPQKILVLADLPPLLSGHPNAVGGDGAGPLSSATSVPETDRWLQENGPKQLELLFRAIVYHPSAPVLVSDSEGNSLEMSTGAVRLLGIPREKAMGKKLADFAVPSFRPQLSDLWVAFLERGEQAGSLRLLGPDGTMQDVEYSAKVDVLPARNVVALRSKAKKSGSAAVCPDAIPSWVQDYALYLLDSACHVVAWYAGAVRIHGYNADEAIGRHVSFLYPASDELPVVVEGEFKRAAREGHTGTEGWQIRNDGSRFWANAITMTLKDDTGDVRGFARVVRDFTDRHERDEQLLNDASRTGRIQPQSAIVGVVSGEFDQIAEVNDAFLELTGYTGEDVGEGRMLWSDFTPPEYAALDELAHEECLRFGACTPYEKEFVRKDGSRVRILMATAVLQLSQFRWISFVHDLHEQRPAEGTEDEDSDPKQSFEEIVGGSLSLRRIQRQVEVVAPTDATVLILGETGTGKELVARAIHRLSPRENLPFVTLNCAAIPTGLLESELFGYERGAFTGALQQKIGRFERAHKGTLFLDEVGDIPIDLQPKLLRALQEKAFERLGGTKTIPIDVRLVAATNRNLTEMMGDKLFRSDLYYRLKVFPITTPPLRERPDDIPMLARFFVKKYAAKMGREIDRIPIDVMAALVSWQWPGNVRELENFIERSVILSKGPSLRAPLDELTQDAMPQSSSSGGTLEEVEREYILRIFKECNGVVTTTATRLGLHRTTLNAMMRKLGITRKDL